MPRAARLRRGAALTRAVLVSAPDMVGKARRLNRRHHPSRSARISRQTGSRPRCPFGGTVLQPAGPVPAPRPDPCASVPGTTIRPSGRDGVAREGRDLWFYINNNDVMETLARNLEPILAHAKRKNERSVRVAGLWKECSEADIQVDPFKSTSFAPWCSTGFVGEERPGFPGALLQGFPLCLGYVAWGETEKTEWLCSREMADLPPATARSRVEQCTRRACARRAPCASGVVYELWATSGCCGACRALSDIRISLDGTSPCLKNKPRR